MARKNVELHDFRSVMREYRFQKKLSQNDIAKMFEMNQQRYSNIETGRTPPTVKFIQDYAKVTGIDLYDYMTVEFRDAIARVPSVASASASNYDALIESQRETIESQQELIAALKETIELLKAKQ